MTIELELPYPISANRYWRPVHAGQHITIVPTKEAKAFKTEIGWCARAAGVRQAMAGPIEVTLLLYPHLPQDWAARARKDPEWWDLSVKCIDLDNAQKVLWDALKGIAFVDDNMIRKTHSEIAVPDGKPRVIVTIKPYARPHPQQALFDRPPVYVPPPHVQAKKKARAAAKPIGEELKDPF